uniref:Nodule-specific cysteine-rich peptide G18 n=1 Tax=Pisum sativum TaxID=3888 RepID=A0A7T8DV83_PEA|nr:nodule-specific cysteine-rich peptide G18 [Pisum sativum]
MAKVVKIIYVMIIFVFLFFVATNVEAGKSIKCSKDLDCPKSMCKSPMRVKCWYSSFCRCYNAATYNPW